MPFLFNAQIDSLRKSEVDAAGRSAGYSEDLPSRTWFFSHYTITNINYAIVKSTVKIRRATVLIYWNRDDLIVYFHLTYSLGKIVSHVRKMASLCLLSSSLQFLVYPTSACYKQKCENTYCQFLSSYNATLGTLWEI